MDLLKHVHIINADALKALKRMRSNSIDCCITSPPYWALRDYGVAGQYGLEASPEAYLRTMVKVFREVRRVLKKDGTCWVNMGDSYAGQRGGYNVERSALGGRQPGEAEGVVRMAKMTKSRRRDGEPIPRTDRRVIGLKPKDLCGMPWRLALAMQADGWYLRRDIIWHKRNPMPETVKDRPTTAHEYFFLFSKSERYHYDWEAIAEPASTDSHARVARAAMGAKSNPDALRNGIRPRQAFPSGWGKGDEPRDAIALSRQKAGVKQENHSFSEAMRGLVNVRNKRSVWSLQSEAYTEAHFATFSPKWIEPAVLAGCRPGGIVLDPFGGSGTTAGVAVAHGRKATMIELNPDYIKLMPARIEMVVRSLRNAPAPAKVPGQLKLMEV